MARNNKRPCCKLFARIRIINEIGELGTKSEINKNEGRLKIETTIIGKMKSVIKLSKVE